MRIFKKHRLTNIVFVLSILTLFYFISNWSKIPAPHKLIFFPSLIFGLYSKFGNLNKFLFRFPSLMLFYFLLVVKYIVLPYLVVANNNYTTFRYLGTVSAEDNIMAYYLIIYELIAIIITLELAFKYMFKNVNLRNDYSFNNKNLSNSNIILYFSIVIAFVGLFFYPHFLNNVIIFKTSSDYTKDIIRNNFITVILSSFVIHIQTFIFLIVVKKYGAKNQLSKNQSIPLIVLLVSILNVIIIWNTNRTTILVNVLITIVVLSYVYPQRRKYILSGFLSLGLVMIVLMTFFRSFGSTNVNAATINTIYGYNVISSYLEVYVSGQSSVATGIKMSHIYNEKITFLTFINDMFLGTNVMQQIVRHFTDIFNNNTPRYFNLYCGFKTVDSLIIPSVSQGYAYFGFIGAPFYTVIVLLAMLHSEKMALKSSDIGLKYSWSFLALLLAGIPGANGVLAIQFFSRKFIPLYLIVKANSIFSKNIALKFRQ